MSTPMTFQNRKSVRPPDKGSFPIDHEGECKKFMTQYMKCLRDNAGSNEACRVAAKDYFQCRMDRKLMKREPWEKLGYKDLENQ